MATKPRSKGKADIVPLRPPTAEITRAVLEARVVQVLHSGHVRVLTSLGRTLECRCAQAVDLGWLTAALAIAPVDAEVSVNTTGLGSVLAIFAGPEHGAVKPERLKLAAREEVELECGTARLRLTKDGRAHLRGRDVLVRGSRVARIQGGTTRLN